MARWLMLVVLMLAPLSSFAAASNRMATPRDVVSLVSQSDAATGKVVKLGLLFRLAKGWHIYWKDAGDAGVPPGITLATPKDAQNNVVAGDFAWPAPRWFVVNSIGDYVETGTVLLPFTATLPHEIPASGIDLAAAAHWLVCSRRICVPEQANFTLHEGFGPAAPSAQSALFTAAAAALPRPSPFISKVAPNGTLMVTGTGLSQSVKSAHFFPDSAAVIANAAPQHLSFIRNGFLLRLKPAGWKPGASLSGVLEITDRTGEMQALRISASPASGLPAAELPRAGLIWPIFAAFLGGLILNLMPCVFPVLAIKALSVARLGTADRKAARIQALAYTAGAIMAMLAIGILLLVLRAGDSSFAWGFQFQSPVFVAIMAWLIFAVGLNFAGLFEIGARFSGIGSNFAARGGNAGSFATGLLAVLVATPCTAPFMGGAIAAALSAPPVAALGIFAALGFGMALPFLVIGFVPGLGRLLPKPGAWMIILRQFMAFPMFATAVWLLWVMVQEAGAAGALVVAGGAVLIAFALWLLRFHGLMPRALAVLAAIGVIALLPRITPAQAAGHLSVPLSIPGAVPYSAARLADLRGQGRAVFIDMSAAWCVTCLVNERVALDPASVQREFHARHVVLMVGDWTRRNPAITHYLAAHGRDGVPLYVYYPPNHQTPVMLPQILTPALVKRALG
jgi:thiol:disulfide interchange protein/DsbC/DsbD-like thiol-disulfide interchange protein